MATTIYGTKMDLNITTMESNETIDVCSVGVPQSPLHTVIVVAVSIVIICNFVILTAIAMNWRMLRHNIVYRYLISCLLSVMCFGALSIMEIFYTFHQLDDSKVEGGILQRYNASDPTHRMIMQRTAFRKGITPAFYLIMQINIAALIYAVSDNIMFVGRFGDQHIKVNNNKKKHTVASLILLFAWIAPILLSLPVPFGWNCIEESMCLPMYRSKPTFYSSTSDTKACSRYWEPMTQSFLSVVIAIYFIVMILMFFMLISTVRKFYRAHNPKSRTSAMNLSSAEQNIFPESSNNYEQNDVEQGNTSAKSNATKCKPKQLSFTFSSKKPSMEKRTKASITKRPDGTRRALDDTIKLLIVLTLLLFISDTPLMILLFVDIFSEDAHSVLLLLVTMALTNAYCACLPFIMLRYISGLRHACVVALTKCPCLRITVTERPAKEIPRKSITEKIQNKDRGDLKTNAEFEPKATNE